MEALQGQNARYEKTGNQTSGPGFNSPYGVYRTVIQPKTMDNLDCGFGTSLSLFITRVQVQIQNPLIFLRDKDPKKDFSFLSINVILLLVTSQDSGGGRISANAPPSRIRVCSEVFNFFFAQPALAVIKMQLL
jgi:hypothetical protein